MALDRPVHAPETADGTTEPAVALLVAPGSAVHGGLAQMSPPPPRFSALLGVLSEDSFLETKTATQ